MSEVLKNLNIRKFASKQGYESATVGDNDLCVVLNDGEPALKTSTMPAASASELGNIYQYTGASSSVFVHGYFYECVFNSSIYDWQQVNVQPSSGGGNSGIEWKTTVDLPSEYSGDASSARAYYTIVGGLPDGEYEFYFSAKTIVDNSRPNGAITFKVNFKIDNQAGRCNGNLGYVFDGNYMANVNRMFATFDCWVYNWMYKNGSDLIIYGDQMFSADILNYNNHQSVPECFKLSAIKNIETGTEYIASGAINLDGSSPSYTRAFDSNLVLKQIASEQYIPEKQSSANYDITQFSVNTVFFNRVGTSYSVMTMNHRESNSWFVVEYIGEYNGSNTVPYAQKIIKATGIFKDCYLADDGHEYIWVMGVDTATAETLVGSVYVVRGVISSGVSSIWFDEIPQNTSPIAQIGPQGYRLGTITGDGLGNIIQYVGETDSNYTNGYYYKANGTVVVVPERISPSDYSEQDWTCGVTNIGLLVSKLSEITGWSESDVREEFKESDLWSFDVTFDGTNTTVNYADFGFISGISSADVLQFLTATYSGSESEISVQVRFAPNYTPESREVQNQSWDRVDVQPLDLTGVSGYDATKTQVLKNVQGTLTWVDE